MKKPVLPLMAALLFFGMAPFFAAAQISEERIETGRFGAEEPESEDGSGPGGKTYKNHWLFLGARLGSSLPAFYTPEGDTAFTGGDTYSLSLDLGLQASVQLFSRLSLQAEVNVVLDRGSLWFYALNSNGIDVDSHTRQFTGASLQFPFMAKLNFYPGKFRVSPFLGIEVLVPLGTMRVNDLFAGERSYAYAYAPPLGLLGGLGAAFPAGPGMIFADLRFAAELGKPELREGGGVETFRRSRVVISAGYEFGFFKKQQTGSAK
jgi:hypothetical protein